MCSWSYPASFDRPTRWIVCRERADIGGDPVENQQAQGCNFDICILSSHCSSLTVTICSCSEAYAFTVDSDQLRSVQTAFVEGGTGQPSNNLGLEIVSSSEVFLKDSNEAHMRQKVYASSQQMLSFSDMKVACSAELRELLR